MNAEQVTRRSWPARVAAGCLVVAVLAAMVAAEESVQSGSRHALEARFVARAATAASFAQADVNYTLERERDLASAELATPTVTQAQFASFLQSLDFGPALLLDSQGRVLDVTPYKASLIGVDIAPRYAHLTAAVGGRQAVSNVVPSAVRGTPVTGFATPFDTPYGQREVSGAYNLASEPMGLYLRKVMPWADSPVYLIDATGKIVTASSTAVGSLAATDPRLDAALAAHTSGFYTDPTGKQAFYVSDPVPGTPWRLVLTIPQTTLFPTSAFDRTLPWLLLAAFAAVATALSVMFVRGGEDRRRLAAVAHIDMLTGISNRRSADERLTALISQSARQHLEFGLLLIDVDHFKSVNDSYGHPVGDDVLKGVATRIRSCLRAEDIVGRWGGEEFVVAVPTTGPSGAATAAERIRTCIAATPFASAHHQIPTTVSIGVAFSGHDTQAQLIERADAALYLAKQTGRNQVVHAPLQLTNTTQNTPEPAPTAYR